MADVDHACRPAFRFPGDLQAEHPVELVSSRGVAWIIRARVERATVNNRPLWRRTGRRLLFEIAEQVVEHVLDETDAAAVTRIRVESEAQRGSLGLEPGNGFQIAGGI